MARNQNIEDFEPGEEVEVFINDEWTPGIIDDIHSYTVFNIRTESQVDKMPSDIRNRTTHVRGQNGNLIVESEIEFRENGIWVPGILISKNYRVDMDDFYGGIFMVEHSNIRRVAQQIQRQAAAPQPAVRPGGIAYEVHNAFSDLDLPKFMTIVRRENNGASNFKDNNNVLEPIVSYINGPDTSLSSEQKTRYTRNIRDTIRQNVNTYITDHPEVKDNILEVIQFVLSQDPNYKDLYIEIFENECMGGYSTGNRQSCTKGMFERIYMANKGTIEGLCFEELQGISAAATAAASRANDCKPVYLELYSAFTPGADIDINDIFQKWYNQFSYDAVPEETNPLRNLSVNSRKQHFRDFVRQDEAISPRIWNNPEFQRKLEQSIQTNNIIFETLNLDAGLGRKKRRNRKTKKNKRKVFSKNKRKSLRNGNKKTKKKY